MDGGNQWSVRLLELHVIKQLPVEKVGSQCPLVYEPYPKEVAHGGEMGQPHQPRQIRSPPDANLTGNKC